MIWTCEEETRRETGAEAKKINGSCAGNRSEEGG